MVLHPGQHSQLPFHADASCMRVFHHLPGQLHIFIKGKGRPVYHHRGISPCYGGRTGVKIPSMVQMKDNGYGAVLPIFFHGPGNIFSALFLILQGCVHKVASSPHKTICQVGPLQYGSGAEHLMDLDGSLCLGHRVDVESALGKSMFNRSLHERPQWNQCHIIPSFSDVSSPAASRRFLRTCQPDNVFYIFTQPQFRVL